MQPECACPVCGSVVSEIPVTILPERGMVIHGGRFAVLTGKEMLLLQRMADVFPRTLSKQALLEWMYQFDGEEPELKIIDVFICKMRKKLDPVGVRIDTLWGKGYGLAVSQKPRIIEESR